MSERYPLLNQPLTRLGAPEVDNFYLDMNGIVHNCTHGPDTDINSRLTEEQMMLKIFAYLERMFDLIRPKKLVYMAIDGCAPRAKMNQQRSRRFRSAKDAAEAAEAQRRSGEAVPEGQPFDSNCITPGTDFMVRLNAHLKWFIRKKVGSDPLWQSPQIILSGHDVPGEGEHKIMEHIRCARASPHWKPNQRHCLYGLDADLIMLGLVTHEPHFCLLREKVRFGGGFRGQPNREIFDASTDPGDSFVLLQVGLLRDYLDGEMRNGLALDALPMEYNLEHVIDDFVFLCYLVGNDFVPSLPTFDINEGALNNLIDLYVEMLPSLGGYLVEDGDVKLERLEMILAQLGAQEEDILAARARDAEAFANKQDRRSGRRRPKEVSDMTIDEEADTSAMKDFSEMSKVLMPRAENDGSGGDLSGAESDRVSDSDMSDASISRIASEPTMMSENFRRIFLEGGEGEGGKGAVDMYKEHYYSQKLGIDPNNPEEVAQVAHDYLEGLIWVFKYYYCGCASWQYFYPHHYAPLASDLKNLTARKIEYVKSEPFYPFQQLLSVMPAGSAHLLPRAYRPLMCEESSPIRDFYPEDFPIDFEGKRNDWEGVCLVPFIDASRLLEAERTIDPSLLSAAEKERNVRSLPQLFQYDESVTSDVCPSPSTDGASKYMPAIHGSKCAVFTLPPYPAEQPPLRPMLAKGTSVGVRSPAGYPTLRTLQCDMRREMAAVNVLGTASKKDSVIVRLDQVAESLKVATAEAVAQATMGQRCFVEWPYLREALVVAVSDATQKITPAGKQVFSHEQAIQWKKDCQGIHRDFRVGRGTDVGVISVMLHVRTCVGLKTQLDGSQVKTFDDAEGLFPLQVTLRKHPAPDMRRSERAQPTEEEAKQALPTGTNVVFLGESHFGCSATVTDSPDATRQSATTLTVAIQPPAIALPKKGATQRLAKSIETRFEPAHVASKRAKCNGMEFGRVTSTIFVQLAEDPDESGNSFGGKRVDLGLGLKHGAKQAYVPGYVRPKPGTGLDGEKMQWEYSDKAVQLVAAYKRAYPWLFNALCASDDLKMSAEDLFPGMDPLMANAQVQNAQKWVKAQPVNRRKLVGLEVKLASDEAIAAIEASIPQSPLLPPPVLVENVKPKLLLCAPEKGKADTVAAGGAMGLGDRVVFVGGLSDTGSVSIPFGACGTVVGLYGDKHVDLLLDVPVAGASDLSGRCSKGRGLLVSSSCLLNVSRPAFAVTSANAHLKSGGQAPTIAPAASQWVARQARQAASVSTAAAAAVEMAAAVAPNAMAAAAAAAAAASAATQANAKSSAPAQKVKGAGAKGTRSEVEDAKTAAAAAIMGSLMGGANGAKGAAPADAANFWKNLQTQAGAAPTAPAAPAPAAATTEADAFWKSLQAQNDGAGAPASAPVPSPAPPPKPSAALLKPQVITGAARPAPPPKRTAKPAQRGGFQGDSRKLDAGEHPSGEDVETRAERLEDIDSEWMQPTEHNPANPKLGEGASMSWQQEHLMEGKSETDFHAEMDARRGGGRGRGRSGGRGKGGDRS